MRILATCLADPQKVLWKGEEIITGIFKKPVDKPVRLLEEMVADDTVGNKKVHGGKEKACYLFSADHYPYWQSQYPHLQWTYGMFGENLTVDGMADEQLRIGDIYNVGTAVVQITMPREPCFKLGIKFDDQGIIEKFITHSRPGAYVRILDEGRVAVGDELTLLKQSKNPLTVVEFFKLNFMRKKDPELLQTAIDNPALPQYKRERLKKEQKKGGF